MKSYKHILIATNLTKEGKEVADRAMLMAKASGAQLSLVHVVEFNPIMYGGGEFAVPFDGDLESSLQEQAKASVRKEGERLGISENNQWIVSGATAEEITQVIKEAEIDLLVIGNHETHGLSFLLGSKANTLLHMMPCNVMAVHMPK